MSFIKENHSTQLIFLPTPPLVDSSFFPLKKAYKETFSQLIQLQHVLNVLCVGRRRNTLIFTGVRFYQKLFPNCLSGKLWKMINNIFFDVS